MDEEKAAVTASPKNILSFDDWREKIISPKGVHRTDLIKKIEEIEQNPLKFNIPPILFRGNGLLLIS